MTLLRICHRTLICLVLASAFLVTLTTVKAEEKAKGTLTYKGPKKTFTVALTHAYLVKGPDTFEEGKIIRRLVLTTSDFTAAIKKADALNGFDGELMEGMIVELVDGPRLNYWVVLNNQLVQSSGVVEPTALKSTADTPEHLAGKLRFDESSSDGPKVDVEFDAPLLKTFTKAR
jgi:hypothetical protein